MIDNYNCYSIKIRYNDEVEEKERLLMKEK